MKPYVRIVDDDEDVRTSIALLAQLAGLDTQTFESAEKLLSEGEFETPGCIVLDIRMPGLSGLDLQKELIARQIDLPIVFLTGHGDVETAVLAFRRGAVDCLLKPPSPETLQAALCKYTAWHERVRAHKLRVSEARAKYDTLTAREKDVLRGVASGVLNKPIAYDCGISVETVKSYRSNALEKLGIRTPVEARDLLILIGIIHLDELPPLSFSDADESIDSENIKRTLLGGAQLGAATVFGRIAAREMTARAKKNK